VKKGAQNALKRQNKKSRCDWMDLALAARDTAANSVSDLPVARLHLIPTPTTPARGRRSIFGF
jgi:hypothetical protein